MTLDRDTGLNTTLREQHQLRAALAEKAARIAELEAAVPIQLVGIMHLMNDEFATPSEQAAVDSEFEFGWKVTPAYARKAYQSLAILGWARLNMLVDADSHELRGRGYVLTPKGYSVRKLLPCPYAARKALTPDAAIGEG